MNLLWSVAFIACFSGSTWLGVLAYRGIRRGQRAVLRRLLPQEPAAFASAARELERLSVRPPVAAALTKSTYVR